MAPVAVKQSGCWVTDAAGAPGALAAVMVTVVAGDTQPALFFAVTL